MNKEEKYYTPEISEFHFGFEYEIFKPEGIDFGGFKSEGGWLGFSIPNPYYGFNADRILKENSHVRVKYLDKEDIESLGFEKFVHKNAKCYKLHNWLLYHFPNNNVVSLNRYALNTIRDSESGNQYFRGVIKNKSELKKLIQQLGIKNE